MVSEYLKINNDGKAENFMVFVEVCISPLLAGEDIGLI